ncbi:RHS repeat-associated core domain-containing protein [Paraburkholderia aspalathi]|uniref:RHS repeat-associated core domain-containing protein n=1 Tax=Paraburkholderia nemoris TaxID=2793076 RepID=UPI00190BAAAC|nr:RHS repeat-associated core domain-containing protein [Paraburkholderia aspalathi]
MVWSVAVPFVYYRNRYYSPGTGRFISEDPLGYASGQTNSYAYVGGNPVSKTDPFGLGPWDQKYGLSNTYWNWLHRQDGGSLIKELKDPRTGQVPKDTALEYYKIYLLETGQCG